MLRIAISELGMVSPELCEVWCPRNYANYAVARSPGPPPACQALIVTAGTKKIKKGVGLREGLRSECVGPLKKISGGPVGPTSRWIVTWAKKVSRTTAMAVAWRASGVRVIFLESPSSALRRSPIIF